MPFEIIAYEETFAAEWDLFCAGAINATFLHYRLFFDYHGTRFRDMSAIILDSGRLVGVFPAAEDSSDNRIISSHPGITYGGIVHQGYLTGDRMIEAMSSLVNYYSKRKYTRLIYKAVPYIYTAINAQDDRYSLFRLNAERTRCDLSSTIDLCHRLPLNERRRRALKKALASVNLSADMAMFPILWQLIVANLKSKFDTSPVHSFDEISLLAKRFPENIIIRCALVDGVVIAGVILFVMKQVWHAQYIAANEHGYTVSALDAVFDKSIQEARESGCRYFDFGTSNEASGKILNTSLYRFKSEFGGGGVAHEYYEIDLS